MVLWVWMYIHVYSVAINSRKDIYLEGTSQPNLISLTL